MISSALKQRVEIECQRIRTRFQPSLGKLKCAEELIDRLEEWSDLESRQTSDVNKIREDLQAQSDANKELPTLATENNECRI